MTKTLFKVQKLAAKPSYDHHMSFFDFGVMKNFFCSILFNMRFTEINQLIQLQTKNNPVSDSLAFQRTQI